MPARMVKVKKLCVGVEFLIVGILQTNAYIISDGKGVFVVDPGSDADEIIEQLDGRKLDAIVLTHYHWDHVDAAAELRYKTAAPVIASVRDAVCVQDPQKGSTSRLSELCEVDRTVVDGDILKVGNMEWRVIETPGHSAGSICLYLDPKYGCHKDGYPVLVSGDTLLYETIGITNFKDSLPDEMLSSLKKLEVLPEDTVVLPGHCDLTTIGAELRTISTYGDLGPNENNLMSW